MNKICLKRVIESLTIYKDNKMSIALTKNVESQYRIKYINIYHYYITKLVYNKKLTVK